MEEADKIVNEINEAFDLYYDDENKGVYSDVLK